MGMTAAETRRLKHLGETVVNQATDITKLKKDRDQWEGIAKLLRSRIKSIFRKVGWLSIGIALVFCAFDFFAAFLHGTQFSFRFQEGFGLNQVVIIAISSLSGLCLLIFGYRGKR